MRARGHECAGKLCERRRPDDHQQGDAVSDDRIALVRLVADASIMSERDPFAPSDYLEPCFVGGVRREVIGVSLDCQIGKFQDLGKLLSEVAVGEIDDRQAARS